MKNWINFSQLNEKLNVVAKFYIKMTILKNDDGLKFYYGWLNRLTGMSELSSGSESIIYSQTTEELKKASNTGIANFVSGAKFNDVKIKIIIVNLTQMFGVGNEPSTTEEIEAMFPNDYYPYSEGELMSMSVNDVVYTDTSSNQVSHPIPQSIQNLDGYGWSAGTAYNYVDFENKKYYKCIERVDLGTVTFFGDSPENNFVSKKSVFGQKLTNSSSIKPNILCLKYETRSKSEMKNLQNAAVISTNAFSDGYVYIKDTSFSDVNSLMSSLQGVYLYYELAEPIVTDISDIIGDTFQEPINVEGGGSLTFKNSNGDGYQLAVPSDIQYVVSLSEVTA